VKLRGNTNVHNPKLNQMYFDRMAGGLKPLSFCSSNNGNHDLKRLPLKVAPKHESRLAHRRSELVTRRDHIATDIY
jgi:hypothetical protein